MTATHFVAGAAWDCKHLGPAYLSTSSGLAGSTPSSTSASASKIGVARMSVISELGHRSTEFADHTHTARSEHGKA